MARPLGEYKNDSTSSFFSVLEAIPEAEILGVVLLCRPRIPVIWFLFATTVFALLLPFQRCGKHLLTNPLNPDLSSVFTS